MKLAKIVTLVAQVIKQLCYLIRNIKVFFLNWAGTYPKSRLRHIRHSWMDGRAAEPHYTKAKLLNNIQSLANQ